MVNPIRPNTPYESLEPVHLRPSRTPIFQDQCTSMKSSSTVLEWAFDVLRNLRDYFFDTFLSVQPLAEMQKVHSVKATISALEKSGGKKELALYAIEQLPSDAKRYLEIGLQRFLQNQSRPLKQYPHANAFLEDRPCSKEVLDLLNSYEITRRELVELAGFLPSIRKRTFSPAVLEQFQRLSSPLRTKILLSLSRLDGHSRKLSEEQARKILRDPTKLYLLRTATATAVRGLKMHTDPSRWHTEAWRCKFWYC